MGKGRHMLLEGGVLIELGLRRIEIRSSIVGRSQHRCPQNGLPLLSTEKLKDRRLFTRWNTSVMCAIHAFSREGLSKIIFSSSRDQVALCTLSNKHVPHETIRQTP